MTAAHEKYPRLRYRYLHHAGRLADECGLAIKEIDRLNAEVAELRQIIDDRNEDARYEDRP